MMKKAFILFLSILLIVLSGCSTPEGPQKDYSESWRERPLPESFDLRNVDTDGDGKGDRCFVTPVRLQNPFGTCWGFAAIAAAEISILGNNLKSDPNAWKTLDLSEKQLAYFTNVPLNDPDNPQNEEGITPEDINDSLQVYNKGGTCFLATSTFAQGVGPSYESDEKYNDWFTYRGANHYADQRFIDGKFQPYSYAAEDDWTIPEEMRFCQDFRLLYSHMLPSPAQINFVGNYMYYRDATNMIKEELLDKKGVLIGFCADTSLPSQQVTEGVYINLNNWAHYTWTESAMANHAVTIVGWDDNYPRENFLKDHMPPENGAWLVKNSWGSGEEDFPNAGNRHWGIEVPEVDEKGNPVLDADGNPVMVGSGYFWLSYFDMSLKSPESFTFANVDENEHIYQHDYLSAADIYTKTFTEPARMANVFTSAHAETINEISCVTAEKNLSVDYRIYILNEDFENPEQGYLAASGTEVFEYGGFHRIPLQEPVYIQEGQKYAVIVTLSGQYDYYYINTPIGLALKGMMNQKAIINPQESYIFADGEWFDYKKIAEEDWAEDSYEKFGGKLYYDNFPIKAYTSYLPANMNIVLMAEDSSLSLKEGKDVTKVGLIFRGHDDVEVGNPEIKWHLLPGSEDVLSMEPDSEGRYVTVKAKNYGNGYVAATVEGIGTSILKIEVKKLLPGRFMPAVTAKEYTGEPVETTVMVLDEGNARMTEGQDYTLKFDNNVNCGIARVEICDPEGNSFDPQLFTYFGIKPQKAEIVSAVTADGSITVNVRDQWASGISGYSVEYCVSGSNQWKQLNLTRGTAVTITGLTSGNYDVRVRGFVDTDSAEKDVYCQDIYYGEYSDNVSVVIK
ncbi:MAG: hypothetical protein IJG59_09700 [Erysipelotrichaceae bacterium]|nr:hypothetical protein [Erysipelotrichaceae bacterium]